MARQPRIDVAGCPQHLIQRGNNRQPCFLANTDRHRYLDWLRRAATDYGGCVHAYVLMSNHVHLLATGAEQGALGRMMQSLGRNYVRYFNSRHQRTGTLWEGRFKSSLVDSERYLLTCYRYIELNPVRAGIVDHPERYRWSSFSCNARGQNNALITPHEAYLALGNTKTERTTAYRRLFKYPLPENDITRIRATINQGKVLGSDAFLRKVQSQLNVRVTLAAPGRPKVL